MGWGASLSSLFAFVFMPLCLNLESGHNLDDTRQWAEAPASSAQPRGSEDALGPHQVELEVSGLSLVLVTMNKLLPSGSAWLWDRPPSLFWFLF